MSRSFDRPDWRQGVPPPMTPGRQAEPYDDLTGPPTGPHGSDPAPEAPRRPSLGLGTPEARPVEPARTRRRGRKAAQSHDLMSPIVPQATVTGTSLTLVVTIMCFLACLTAGAVYMVYQSASAWTRDVSSEVTVQIEPRERVDTAKTAADVERFLVRQPGIVGARLLSLNDSIDLVEPWLGKSEALKALPVPRLIALELDRGSPPRLDQLRSALAGQFKGVTLDDHRHWQAQIQAVTRSFYLGGLAILLLVAAATTAIIISATRSAMASNREIVEVLHFVGATDRFIAREFETQFLRLGIRAGLVGALCAMAVFFLLPGLMAGLGGGAVTMAELKRLVGVGTLDTIGYLFLVLVVLIIAGLCMVTSRLSVKHILHSQH